MMVSAEDGADVSGAPVCPACAGQTAIVKCKIVCTRCHRIVENCCGD